MTPSLFESLWREAQPAVTRYLARLARNRADVDDLAQETAIKAWRYRDGFHGGNAQAWFLSVARSVFVDFLRKQVRRVQALQADDAKAQYWEDPGPSPFDVAAGKIELERILLAASDLPDIFRNALFIQVDSSTIRNRRHRARQRLREALSC